MRNDVFMLPCNTVFPRGDSDSWGVLPLLPPYSPDDRRSTVYCITT